MNWVGGSRTRVLIKQEKRRQKEYFERNKLKSKMKLLGVLSPVKNSTVSLDLLNLHIVNQISCKKKTPEAVKKPVHVNMNRDIKMPLRQYELELPVSPPRLPSKLCLDDTENNTHCQKLGNKEGCGPVQSSKIKDSYSMFEPHFIRTKNCSFAPPIFSTELSSDRHIPKQNFTPTVVPSPLKVAFEKKQNDQLNNVNCSDSLVSKLSECQDGLSSSYEAAKCGILFEQLNNPGNGSFLTRRPGIPLGEDWKSMNERQSDFVFEKQAAQRIWGQSWEEISNFFEDVNQATHSILSENCGSYVDQNMINLLSIDQQMMQKTFDKCIYDNLGNTCLVTNFGENQPTDGCVRSIFTVPESTFTDPAFNKTSCPEKYQPNKKYQREHNSNEIHDLRIFLEDSYPASYEKQGKHNDYHEKMPQKNNQENPVNSVCKSPLEGIHANQLGDFGLGEVMMEKGTCSLKGRPAFKRICHDLESSQGSQCSSYSPRPTESCFSSSSEMLSEDEDQILQQTEDSSKMSTKTTETSNNFYLENKVELPDNKIVNKNAKFHKQNEKFHQYSVKNSAVKFPQSQCNLAHAENKTSNCIMQVVKCDTGVQTETASVMQEKLDAAIQCDILSECACGRDLSSLGSGERCTQSIMSDTTGGQDILTNR
ncbi:regulator of DNA class I crossover intermediates 1 [Cavia porcellus]|uniref:regulator of DNA class I crossover intermediates 1 n=1 Tax=Cavia porcellus TaxID=10141 RepID=UPI002FE185A1